ncbi:histidine kinase [Caenimonas sedimenti]|uniref:Histidine kinase n=1 Tax=Caenimonas sedimenti TaxID=2596921 RepID=A0A562ZE38_9BURK|nr:MHYT domain-containing protein [Caenimonas sedimenti]TWO64445.1 histidine kinase [Caenimonas sedimenti]
MNLLMPASYAPSLVALSFVIAVVGAFVALTASAGIVRAGRRISVFNAVTSGTALGGIGVWAMHFVGMLSLRVDMAVSYALPETLVSLIAAVGCSAMALLWVARGPDSLARMLGAGVLLGLGVSAMHYLGMAGMRFGGFLQWSWPLVAASIVIAVLAATAALWLAFAVRSLQARLLASVLMATAVCAMHYTGMEAGSFICTTPASLNFPQGDWLMTSLELPLIVSISAFGMAFVIFIDQMFQRLEHRHRANRLAAAGTPRR